MVSPGACSGHTAAGATPVSVMNLTNNPSAEVTSTGATPYNGTSISRVNSFAAVGTYAFSTTTNFAWAGQSQGMYVPGIASATAGTQYTCSLAVRGTNNRTIQIVAQPQSSSGTNLQQASPVSATMSDSWVRYSTTFTTPATTSRVVLLMSLAGTSGVTIMADAIMCTEGTTTRTYADGNSPGWSWSGAADNSTSTGPAL